VSVLGIIQRWRVRGGYVLATVVLMLARPTLSSILLGAAIGSVGLFIRAYAAGFLHKQEVLTVIGPYAYTRNPLYFGSSILAVGAAVAMHSLWAAVLLLAYFALVYSVVMRREETELRHKHGALFDAYAESVPLFFPQLAPSRELGGVEGSFSLAQYERNREYRASFGFFLFLLLLAIIWRLRVV
jgi:protein-S-isoprenylcysteine O-methyltransferase Ste14